MTTGEGQKLILLSAVTVLGIEVMKAATTDAKFTPRLFVGAGITYTSIAAVSEFAPGPAAAFALLIMTTVLLTDGAPTLSYIMGNASGPTPTPTEKVTQ